VRETSLAVRKCVAILGECCVTASVLLYPEVFAGNGKGLAAHFSNTGGHRPEIAL